MREIIPDRIKNCKIYNKILSKIASKRINIEGHSKNTNVD